MSHLLPLPKLRFFDSNGSPLVGGKLYSYAAGTSTLQATFTDQTETGTNANPVVLDANGEASVWISSNAYKFVLKDSTDITVWTVDKVSTINDLSITTAKLADGVLSADSTGRAKMANNFLSADSVGQAKMQDGFLSTTTGGRAKMADGFVTSAKIATGAVGSTQIASGAVGTTQLADGSLTASKFDTSSVTGPAIQGGSVTPAKLASLNYALSSSSGSYTTTSSTVTAITNQSITFTPSGSRPVMLKCLPAAGVTGSITVLVAGTNAGATVSWYRDGTLLVSQALGIVGATAGALTSQIPCSSLDFIDTTATAVAHTYTLRVSTNGCQFNATNITIIAYEMA